MLAEHRAEILAEWFERITRSYESAAFLRNKKDRFSNPIGYAFLEGARVLLDVLVDDGDLQTVAEPLELMVKIRSLEGISPSEVVGFIFVLKDIVRQRIGTEPQLESRIDRLALMAFDMYMASREKIAELRSTHAASSRFHRFKYSV